MTGLFVFEEDCAMHILKLEFHLAGLRSNKSGLATISTMQQRLCCGYCSKLIMAFNHAFKFSLPFHLALKLHLGAIWWFFF